MATNVSISKKALLSELELNFLNRFIAVQPQEDYPNGVSGMCDNQARSLFLKEKSPLRYMVEKYKHGNPYTASSINLLELQGLPLVFIENYFKHTTPVMVRGIDARYILINPDLDDICPELKNQPFENRVAVDKTLREYTEWLLKQAQA